MDILKELSEHRFVAYGYGQAFKIVSKFVDINCSIVVDNDPQKWGTNDGFYVIGSKHLKRIDLSQYKILIFPFDYYGIFIELLALGVEASAIYTLFELMKDTKFRELYNEHKLSVPFPSTYSVDAELNCFTRKLRYQNVAKQPLNCRQLFSRWFNASIPLIYRGINLRQVLAANVSTLLEYVYLFESDVSLHYPPISESYDLRGNGDILVPMFARPRIDHVNRMRSIVNDITSDITIITYSDMDVNIHLLPRRTYKFKFSFSRDEQYWVKRITQELEVAFFILTNDEKDWMSYLINYYIQLIDFYIDVLRINCKVMLSIFPYYEQENLLFQMGKLQGAVDVVYQHGNYTDATSNERFHPHLYTFALKSDYYLVWNQKAKHDLINVYEKEDTQVIVLGNPMQIEKNNTASTSLKKFLIVCPGKVFDHLNKVNELLNDAELVADIFRLKYDIRYHPLNKINPKDSILSHFDKNVYANNCNYDDYAFFIGRESTLLDEIRDGGFRVFTKSEKVTMPYEYSNSQELQVLVNQAVHTSFNEDNRPKQTSAEEIRKKYAEFLINLLKKSSKQRIIESWE
ncbi:hypothetical protein EHV15_04490 [Paenibacillus oralis]|uniref:Uncharacterized protein n=1 Tax=Paenibacillus oralis TaxID=2490856 RepID=A0A3P3TYE0_9BACL|nr:hypothetical protein [Paenibacillus oralis]RRJ62288.1 hypothetical protein EHV15_04490 [Paenibacillus oralis]